MTTVLIPIVLAGLYGIVMFQFSAWSMKRQLSQQSNPLLDPNLEKIMLKFANVLEVEKIRINIFETEPINGLAAPDGRIFITRGFYKKYQNGDITVEEISSVVAHELGHVALGHIRRRMIDFSGQNAVRAALGALLSRLVPGLGGMIASIIGNLLMAKLSRQDEYEADEYASALMIKSGLGIEPQVSMFKKLDKISNQQGSVPAWLMSHPPTQERINSIKTKHTKIYHR
ncbi:MAG: M48 family metallopeptidase [Paracoccaceae bacterium]|jgi:putative metalloprotease|nr:MAG: peptidase M48 [Paracoccaceae bacterium]|tara:strand:+ start:680 stop:1366 length:687 start_codon:yes stop_codon:yes gene_type:complete